MRERERDHLKSRCKRGRFRLAGRMIFFSLGLRPTGRSWEMDALWESSVPSAYVNVRRRRKRGEKIEEKEGRRKEERKKSRGLPCSTEKKKSHAIKSPAPKIGVISVGLRMRLVSWPSERCFQTPVPLPPRLVMKHPWLPSSGTQQCLLPSVVCSQKKKNLSLSFSPLICSFSRGILRAQSHFLPSSSVP